MHEEPYSVIHEDGSLIVAAKQAGVPAQSDRSGDSAVSDILAERYGPLHVVHRIDRPVSGLVVYARTPESAASLSAAFREGKVGRRYWAIVSSAPPASEDTLHHTLSTHRGRNKSYVVSTGGKPAELAYRLAAESERYWLLDVELRTGRHHQIRAQLAAIGCPIRGDLKYGAKRSLPGGGIGLHARLISLDHPHSGQRVTYTAPAPRESLWIALTAGLPS